MAHAFWVALESGRFKFAWVLALRDVSGQHLSIHHECIRTATGQHQHACLCDPCQRWTTLAQEPFRLIVPRGVRGSDWAELLTAQRFIRYDRNSIGGRQVDRFLRDAHLQVRDVSELDELEAIVALVAAGVGIALVPQTSGFRRWPPQIRAIDLGSRTFHREIGLVHRAEHHLSGPARDLAGFVRAAYTHSP